MSRSQRMARLVELARIKERGAADRLGARQRALAQAKEKLVALGQYRTEYFAQMTAQGGQGGGFAGADLLGMRAFLEHLDVAMKLAEEHIQRADRLVESARLGWLVEYNRVKAMDEVAGNLRRVENNTEVLREQFEMDDLPRHAGFLRGGADPHDGD